MSSQIVTATESPASTASIISLDLSSGNSYSSYSPYGSMQSRTLCNLSDEYWVSAGRDSQILHFIPRHSSPKIQPLKVICSGKISAAAITKCNGYIFVGIGHQTYLWCIATGELMAILDGPFQPVSVIAVNNLYAVIGSEDGSVTMWQICAIIRKHQDNKNEMSHTWRKHTAAVTDLLITSEPIACSSSLDSTVKIYHLERRTVLMNVLFDNPLHSVVMDPTMYQLFCGSSNGNILLSKLYPDSNSDDEVFSNGAASCSVFNGHTGKVLVLRVSADGTQLASGSDDNTLKIWNISSRQCIRTINYKGPVVNISIDFKRAKSKNVSITIAKVFNRTVKKTGAITSLLADSKEEEDLDEYKPKLPSQTPSGPVNHSYNDEVEKLKSSNEQLYKLAVAQALNEF